LEKFGGPRNNLEYWRKHFTDSSGVGSEHQNAGRNVDIKARLRLQMEMRMLLETGLQTTCTTLSLHFVRP
jgi:hypothetical protein